MADVGGGGIVSNKDFPKNPGGLQRKWSLEILAAQDNQKKWRDQAKKADLRYRGETDTASNSNKTRLNLYHANINIMLAILFGQVPKVDVSRRFDDANDDTARVSSEALQRLLNTDIEDSADDFRSEIKDSLQDWKIAGLGVSRLRYEAEFETVPADDSAEPVIEEHDEKTHEDIATEYIHWQDFLWSPCRRWKEVRWVAFRVEMTRDQLVKRFGEKIGKTVPLQTRSYKDGTRADEIKDAWSRASVWEIWNKEDNRVYWFSEGYDRILDVKRDPMGLEGFFPCPRPLMANLTTTRLMPKPDLELDKDLYDEIDDLADRLRKLVRRAELKGAYNKAFPELARIVEEGKEGQLIGVAGWGALSEKGGLASQMDFLPLDMIVKAIDALTTKLIEKINLLYQATGLSDIVRGEASQMATATEQRLKAGFASTRLQTDQDEVSRFASDLQRLRAEIISKHYDPKTIVERSNLQRVETIDAPSPPPAPGMPPGPPRKVPNMELISAAVELIKSDFWQYRIEVKSDAIALRDYAALKQERVEAIASLAGLFQQALPMVQMYPGAAPFVLEIGKWLIAATKGAQQLEASFDRFSAQVEKAALAPKPPQPPDPKLEAVKVKAQAEAAKARAGMQQTQLDGQVHAAKARMDLHLATQKHGLDMHKLSVQTEAEAARAAAAAFKHPEGGA